MDILDLFFNGHVDIIMDSYTVEQVIDTGDYVDMYAYLYCLISFRRYDIVYVITNHLKSKNTPESEALCLLVQYNAVPDVYISFKSEIINNLSMIEISDIDIKVIILRTLMYIDIKYDETHLFLDKFVSTCEEFGYEECRIFKYIKKFTDLETGTQKKYNYSKKLDIIYSVIPNEEHLELIEDSVFKKHYEKQMQHIVKLIYNLYKRNNVDIEDFIQTVHLCSSINSKISIIDIEPYILSMYANAIRLLNRFVGGNQTNSVHLAKKLIDRFIEIYPAENLDDISYNYLSFVGDNMALCDLMEKNIICKKNLSVDNMIKYMILLCKLERYDRYEEMFEKYDKYVTSAKNRIGLSGYNLARMRYFLITNQITSIFDIDINDNKSAVLDYSKSMAITKNKINILLSFIKSKGFKISEQYRLDDSACCFDDENSTICSICSEYIENTKVTMVECRSCKKYVGHVVCLGKWLKINPTCPLCRC